MKKIERTTLVIIDTKNYGEAYNSLMNSMKECQFDKVIFFTDSGFIKDDKITVVKINTLYSKDEYSDFVCKELWKHIDTDFILLTQHDSWVLAGEQFDERLYDYDYAGALWLENDGLANGNGGFSWRSKKLLDAVGKDDFVAATAPEDVAICRVYRHYLEKTYDLKWATDEICEQFSFELRTPIRKTFGFHSYFHRPFQETIMLTRRGACGDVIALEPVLKYYYNKGYRVVLNTGQSFFNYFMQHYFKVHSPNEIDGRLKVKEINLDLAYEVFPKQLHLKSYFEMCGIEDYELENPQLCLSFDTKSPVNKLFKKYCVIHVDIRNENGRNVMGINWSEIISYLGSLDYTVVQVGIGKNVETGAIHFNTPSEPLLMYLIGGADLFLGVDSAPAHVAVAMKTPAVVFFGSVNPDYIYPDKTDIEIIKYEKVCETPSCWHNEVTTSGKDCVVDKAFPPCVQFTNEQVINAIKKLQNEKTNFLGKF